MKRTTKTILSICFVLMALVIFGGKTTFAAQPEGIIETDGTKLVYPDGTEYKIKAISFANQVYGNPSSVTSTHHDENAYKILSEMGFNSVRFYINYGLFESDKNPYVYREEGFAWIDKNIQQAEKYGIKLILNMHYPQGGYQSSGEGTALWTDAQNQERLIALWTEIARRYADCDTILGYGLVNEPIVAKTDSSLKGIDIWKNLAQRITSGVRKYDKKHIVFIENIYGSQIYDQSTNSWVVDKNDTDAWTLINDNNVVYEFHFYNPLEITHMHIYGEEINKDNSYKLDTNTVEAMICYALKWGKDRNVPMFMGEFGTTKVSYENNALGEQWMRAMMQIIYKYDINFSYHNFHERNFGLYTTSSSVAYDDLNEKLYSILMEYFELVAEDEVNQPEAEDPEVEDPEVEDPEVDDPEEEDPEIEKPHVHNAVVTVVPSTTKANGSILQACDGCGDVFYYTDVAQIKSIKLSETSFRYTGAEIKPNVIITDIGGNVLSASHYTVKYYNNVRVGTATVKVTFHGYYAGTLSTTFKIKSSYSFFSKSSSKSSTTTTFLASERTESVKDAKAVNATDNAQKETIYDLNKKEIITAVIRIVKNKISEFANKTLQ